MVEKLFEKLVDMFSFLRGRLRTRQGGVPKRTNVYAFSFLRGRLRTNIQAAREMAACSFHSFEVGFGLKSEGFKSLPVEVFSFLRGRLRTKNNIAINDGWTGFHSFEVGFGHRTLPRSEGSDSCFHSFEVGFGLSMTLYQRL